MFRLKTYVCLLALAGSWVSCGKNEPATEIGSARRAIDVTYRIDQPDVTRHQHEYPYITFQQYDEITVRAGGCVTIFDGQSGDSYRYSYVRPQGYVGDFVQGIRADTFLHGLIRIPGATAGLEPIASLIARSPVFIPEAPPGAGVDPQQLALVLGYDYAMGTNNYYDAPSWGTQCDGEGPAWVELDVTHHSLPPVLPCPYPSNPSSAFDLYWTALDPNMFPLNPMWGQQCFVGLVPLPGYSSCNHFRYTPGWEVTLGNPPCSNSLLTTNTARLNPFTCPAEDFTVHGHANWGWVTFTNGTIYYDQYSGGWPQDSDVNAIYYADNRSVFNTNPHIMSGVTGLDLEFIQDETTDQMQYGFWNDFRRSNESGRHQMMDGKPAQVVGLLGVDNIEGSKMELHPVLGLAMKIRSYPADPYDTWAVFARPWGNEGGCGELIMDSAINNYSPGDMRFMLPHSFSSPYVYPRHFSEAYVNTSFPGATLLTLRFPTALNYGEIDISPTCIPQCPIGVCSAEQIYDGCGHICSTCGGPPTYGTCCGAHCYPWTSCGCCCDPEIGLCARDCGHCP